MAFSSVGKSNLWSPWGFDAAFSLSRVIGHAGTTHARHSTFFLTWSKRRPRLIHGHGGETGLVVRWFVRGPVVVSYCGDDLLGTPRVDGPMAYAYRLRRVILRQQARLLTATVTKSAEMEATLPRSARDRNSVIPNGVDRSLFRPQPRHDARLELGWASTERIVVFASDPAVQRKRYWLAEAACREAQRERRADQTSGRERCSAGTHASTYGRGGLSAAHLCARRFAKRR